MNSASTIRKMISGFKKNHHRHDSGALSSKKERSVINKITKLCQKKNKEVKIIPVPGACGYGAVLKEDIDPRSQRQPFFLYKVLFEVDAKKGNHFAFYSHDNSWSCTDGSSIDSLTLLIKRVEGVKV